MKAHARVNNTFECKADTPCMIVQIPNHVRINNVIPRVTPPCCRTSSNIHNARCAQDESTIACIAPYIYCSISPMFTTAPYTELLGETWMHKSWATFSGMSARGTE